ncbi:failed axon connections homolog [Glandiceps talaboti]
MDFPKDTVILRHAGRHRYVPSYSPFPLKLETYLRFAKIPYVNIPSSKWSPKHKTPWIEFNGEILGDTSFIIEFLNEKFEVDLNKHLNPSDKATARAFQKMAEENFYCNVDIIFILGNKNFMFGDEPCEEDCAIFGQLAMVVWVLPDSPQGLLVKGDCKNLEDYCYRMKERFWPDWEQCIMGDQKLKGFLRYPDSDPTLWKGKIK